MATSKVTKFPASNCEPAGDVEVDASVDVGVSGLLAVLAGKGGSAARAITCLDGYTTQELVTMANQGGNIVEETTMGLRTLGRMMLDHDGGAGPVNHTGIGALIDLLTELQSSASIIEANAAYELEQRGYAASGRYLAATKAA